jgi:hypothetical protein
MVQPTSSTGFFSALFTPLPESYDGGRKDFFDHVGDYAGTSEGSWDLFRIGNHIFTVIEMYLTPAHRLGELIGKVKEVFNTVGIALGIPKCFSSLNALRHSITNLFTVQDLPYSDPLRTSRIAQAAKKSFLDSIILTNAVSQTALFLENVKIFIFDAAHLRIIGGINNVTSAIEDGMELIGEYFKLKTYHSAEAQPRTASEAAKLEQKKTLSWITIAKDVSSVALAAIAVGVLASGTIAQGVAAIPATILSLSAFWLTMKLIACFYQRAVVDAPVTSQ